MRHPHRNALVARRGDPFARLIDRFFSDQLPELFTTDQLPRTNIAEDDAALTVSLEMPGVDESDIDVQLEDNQLLVRAERKSETEESGKTWHRVEQRYGSMSRTIALPKGLQADAIEAVYKRGVLTLTIPKAEAEKPTRIEI